MSSRGGLLSRTRGCVPLVSGIADYIVVDAGFQMRDSDSGCLGSRGQYDVEPAMAIELDGRAGDSQRRVFDHRAADAQAGTVCLDAIDRCRCRGVVEFDRDAT